MVYIKDREESGGGTYLWHSEGKGRWICKFKGSLVYVVRSCGEGRGGERRDPI